MDEFEPENAPGSSATPEEGQQPESNTQASQQLNQERNIIQPEPEPEPVPSTSGINSKGKRLLDPKSRLYRKKRENWEESIVSAFKYIKISGELKEDDSSDNDCEQEEKKREAKKKKSKFESNKNESAILELAIGRGDTYPQVVEAEDEPGPSTSFNSPWEIGTLEDEPQPVGEENLMDNEASAQAHSPASPPPNLLTNVSSLSRNVMSSTPFNKLNIPKEMIGNLRDSLGITITTKLQAKAIPILMQEKDVLMHAPWGTGKTVAFAVHVIHHLLLMKPKVCCEDGIRILVVVPNKECVIKTYEIFTALVWPSPWIVIGQFGGSENFRTERELMKRGAIIVITTPTRFLDHVHRTSNLFLKNLSCLIVDGVDEVFGQNGEKHISDIITVLEKGVDYLHHPDYVNTRKKEHVEASRQTVFTCSSITEQVAYFVGLNMTKPMLIDDKDDSPPKFINIPVAGSEAKNFKLTLPLINQHYILVPERMKLVALVGFVLWKFRVAKERRIIVFTGTQTMADFFAELFVLAYGKTDPELEQEESDARHFFGLHVYKISPLMSRKDIVNSFMTLSRTKCGVLFCTDSAVMGVDLPIVDWIIHYHAPTCTSNYMARIGMANPGYQIGSSVSLLLPSEKGYVQELKNHEVTLTGMKLREPFRYLWSLHPSTYSIDDMIFEMQEYMEDIVHRSPRMHEKACLAFASWCRLYSSYPENLKHIFRINSIQMENYLHSFALRGQSAFAIDKAKKFHAESRRKRQRKRNVPAEDADLVQDLPTALPPIPMPPPDWARMPMQDAAAAAPIETEQDEAGKLEEATCAKDLSEGKKRKNDEVMWVSDDEEDDVTPEKKFRLRGGKWHLRGVSIFGDKGVSGQKKEPGKEKE